MDIVIVFDGTCVTHAYPKIGKDIGAVPVLKRLVTSGNRLVLFTMRCDSEAGNHLTEAVEWFTNNGIPLYGIQKHPGQHIWTDSPKAYGNLIIDDAALGAPVIENPMISNRPFIDWEKVSELPTPKGGGLQKPNMKNYSTYRFELLTLHRPACLAVAIPLCPTTDVPSAKCLTVKK